MHELERMFENQKKLQRKMGLDPDKPTQEYINLMFIGIIIEASEAIEFTPWKPWKKSMRLNKEQLQKEAIDLWHFVINLSIAAGLDSNCVFEKYLEKNKINFERQENGY